MVNSQESGEQGITKQYLDLLSKIKDTHISTAENTQLDYIIVQAEELFQSIEKPSTLKLDARLFSEAVSMSSDRLEKSMRNFVLTTDAFLSMSKESFAKYFKRATTFHYGIKFAELITMGWVEKPRNVAERAAQSSNSEMKQPGDKVEKEESNMIIAEKIRDLVKQKEREYFRLVIDVDSYSKTVENMFYLAFAVRMKMVNLKMNNNKFTVVKWENGEEKEDSHMIVELDYEEYINLIKTLKLKTSLIN